MRRSVLAISAATIVAIAIGACAQILRPPVEVKPLPRQVDFRSEVKPVLDRRCVVCHSCYNAACQLKLSSYEGTDRGGSKDRVYSSSRLKPQDPSRLFMDAHTTEAWRAKGFHSVTASTSKAPLNDSVMLQLLDAKRQHPQIAGNYVAEAEDQTCAADPLELSAFLDRNPDRGMPFGFPAIEDSQFELLATWLQQGATGPSPDEQSQLTSPSPAAAAEIEKWQDFLNRPDAKHVMTARYLYEHFFLAHLNFGDANRSEFYQLVRSTTPPGEPIDVIATVRPYDAPGVDRFYYRFRKIHSTIVYKTHMVIEFTDATLARYQELFIDTEWLEPPYVVPLDDETGANPFLIYAQIPPRVRYAFLLDHSKYIIQTFIRGPVCRGQIALNVITDHFWVFFVDPDSDQTVLRPRFLIEQAENLQLPTEEGSTSKILSTFSDGYRERYNRFYRAKTKLYQAIEPEGFDLDAIWKGRRASDAPALTVYRHFDSASVHKGVIGDLPRTAWVIDYSQFERIYYALVAGFDVFGNLSHQVNVRRYMDYLRMEGELNFLHFMPPDARLAMLQSWYVGDGAFEATGSEGVVSTSFGTKIDFQTDEPKREFIEMVVDDHLLEKTSIGFDNINYNRAGISQTPMPESFNTHEDIRNGFRALTAPGTAFIQYNSEWGVNLFFVRFRNYQGKDHFVSAVINRWHDNVNSMFGEAKRLDSSKDTIDFVDGSIGSYPNYFFVVDGVDVPDFFDMLENYDGSPEYLAKVRKYGVNRADPEFWETYDWFQNWLNADDPLNAGLYDLNRYYAEAEGVDDADATKDANQASE